MCNLIDCTVFTIKNTFEKYYICFDSDALGARKCQSKFVNITKKSFFCLKAFRNCLMENLASRIGKSMISYARKSSFEKNFRLDMIAQTSVERGTVGCAQSTTKFTVPYPTVTVNINRSLTKNFSIKTLLKQ